MEVRNNFFHNESGKTLVQVAQRGGECPVHCKGVRIDEIRWSLPA